MRLVKLALLVLCGAILSSVSLASLTPTQAWRLTFNNSTFDDKAGPTGVDASGYGYVYYVVSTGPKTFTTHLVKIGPSSNMVFDVTQSIVFTDTFTATGLTVSPIIGGKQYIYVTADKTINGVHSAYICKYDTAGVLPWGGGMTQTSHVGNSSAFLVGIYASPDGNLYIAMNLSNSINQPAFETGIFGPNGSLLAPYLKDDLTVIAHTAIYSPTMAMWIVTGDDAQGPNPNSTRWLTFDPVTGSEGQTHYLAGMTTNDGSYQQEQYFPALLSGDRFVIVRNTTIAGPGGTPVTRSHTFSGYNSSGTLNASFGGGASSGGLVSQVAQDTPAGTLYLVGKINSADTKAFIEQYDSNTGGAHWSKTNQAVDRLSAWQGGFYSSWYNAANNALYIEHYDDTSGLYDWGKSYIGTGASPNQFAGFASFQNYFYWIANISNSATGYDVVVDRFVTGICFQSISSSGTVQAGKMIDVTLHLNGNAPLGGVTIALNSNNASLLMPNGTKSQNFTVTSGNSSVIATLHVPAGSPASTAGLLAIQNGIMRRASITITP